MPWPTKKLGEVCECYFSGIWGENPDNKGNVFVVRVSDVKEDGIIDYDKLPLRYVEEEKIPKYQLQTGDLVVVKSSGSKKKIISGKTAMFIDQKGRKILASNFVLALRPNQKLVLPKWLLFYLNGDDAKKFVEKIIGITTFPNLKPQEYLKMEIPLPPLKIQKQIVARIEELFEKIDKAKELRQKAQEQTAQIFPAALEGIFSRSRKEKWQIKTIGEVTTRIQYGLSVPIPQTSDKNKTVPILRMANVTTDGQMDYSDIKYIEITQNDFLKFGLNLNLILFI